MAVLKIVSQHVVNQRLLVRVTEMCTRTSASVLTLSRHAATTAVPHSRAAHQRAVAMAVAMAAGSQTLLPAVLQQPVATVAVTAVVTAVETAAAMQTQAAVLQLPVVTDAETAAGTLVAKSAMMTAATLQS